MSAASGGTIRRVVQDAGHAEALPSEGRASARPVCGFAGCRCLSEEKAVNEKSVPNETDARVPLFGSWRKAYLVVVLVFVLEIAFFYFVSRFFL